VSPGERLGWGSLTKDIEVVDGLDDQAATNVEQPRGRSVVAIASRMEQPRERDRPTTGCCGGPPRTRTLDPLIKSQLLYHLS
jgi:hypothetical protein